MNLGKQYISKREPEKEIDEDLLTQDLIAFLVDDQKKSSGQYTDLISEFVLKNENNNNVQRTLETIREGSILYIGLNYNINETGNLTKKLTLFLGTEVLFSLAGFNGEVFGTKNYPSICLEHFVENCYNCSNYIYCYFFREKTQ